MPTPTGLPKPGEVWRRTYSLPPDWIPETVTFIVIRRGRGDYFALWVHVHSVNGEPVAPAQQQKLWVDAAYWHSRGELAYVGKAGPETRKRIGLPA
jgi:hypothetical protein